MEDLALASEDEIMKQWEGLGYYSRARNMHQAAKSIAKGRNGHFPETYNEILALKGVGPYTAAAIASFAYNLPHAVVDGNVFRVLARYFGIEQPIDTTPGKKLFQDLAQELLVKERAGDYNQAIMDFGATHCTPKTPKCQQCSLSINCSAFQNNQVQTLPVKSKKLIKKERFFYYLVVNQGEDVWINKRTEKDIWQKLYEFPMVEKSQLMTDVTMIKQTSLWEQFIGDASSEIISVSKPFRQVLTHQKIIAFFLEIDLKMQQNIASEAFIRVKRKNLVKFAFPKIIDWYLQDKTLYLI